MNNLNDMKYDCYRDQVYTWWIDGKSKDNVLLALKDSEDKLADRLKDWEEEGKPPITIEEWKSIVKFKWQVIETGEKTVVGPTGTHEHFNAQIPISEASAWQRYKHISLKERSKWSDPEIMNLECSVRAVLSRLRPDTHEFSQTKDRSAVQGMTVGYVQSGKTAHMAGLMSMAADHGFNMFIILTGIIDNLRQQTQSRLYKDLSHENSALHWTSLEHLSKQSSQGSRLCDLHLNSNQRYMTSVLKNGKRLNNLIQWFKQTPSQWPNIKLLVIDDESDQASVNTQISKKKQTTIFKRIKDILDLSDGDYKLKAVNYIGYTATPYSVLLNDGSKNSLYPHDFIATLPMSDKYFGAAQIFGHGDYPGLDIVRDIDLSDDVQQIKKVHDGESDLLPQSFLDALHWFLVSVSVQRLWGYSKPVSMLIHTSMKQQHHSLIDDAVQGYFQNTSVDVMLKACKMFYEAERVRFGVSELSQGFTPAYGCISEVKELPEWSQIEEIIKSLVNKEPTRLLLQDDKEKGQQIKYHDGLHICIDNSANHEVGDDEYVRLLYPSKEDSLRPFPKEGFCPAFIIIGGNTLSRGLTIEGLMSSYFLRTTTQADTLMQMGRWFGYRKGYELLPRIWMTQITQEKFRFLARVENDFREQVGVYARGYTPSEQAPGILDPKRVFGAGLRIAARNKMTNAKDHSYDFQGQAPQLTAYFADPEIQRANLKETESFLNALSIIPRESYPKNSSSLIFESVAFKDILSYLEKLEVPNIAHFFNKNELFAFSQWTQKIMKSEEPELKKVAKKLSSWNVVIGSRAGLKPSNSLEASDDVWKLSGWDIPKVSRTRLVTYEATDEQKEYFSIKVLRSVRHIAADGEAINNKPDVSEADDLEDSREFSTLKVDFIERKRLEAKVNDIPQLLIYRIKGSSQPPGWSDENWSQLSPKQRHPLWRGADQPDVIGVSIIIPGIRYRGGAVTHVSVSNIINERTDIDGADESAG